MVLFIGIAVLFALQTYLCTRYERALIEISHYHGDSVEELVDIAYKARHIYGGD